MLEILQNSVTSCGAFKSLYNPAVFSTMYCNLCFLLEWSWSGYWLSVFCYFRVEKGAFSTIMWEQQLGFFVFRSCSWSIWRLHYQGWGMCSWQWWWIRVTYLLEMSREWHLQTMDVVALYSMHVVSNCLHNSATFCGSLKSLCLTTKCLWGHSCLPPKCISDFAKTQVVLSIFFIFNLPRRCSYWKTVYHLQKYIMKLHGWVSSIPHKVFTSQETFSQEIWLQLSTNP